MNNIDRRQKKHLKILGQLPTRHTEWTAWMWTTNTEPYHESRAPTDLLSVANVSEVDSQAIPGREDVLNKTEHANREQEKVLTINNKTARLLPTTLLALLSSWPTYPMTWIRALSLPSNSSKSSWAHSRFYTNDSVSKWNWKMNAKANKRSSSA